MRASQWNIEYDFQVCKTWRFIQHIDNIPVYRYYSSFVQLQKRDDGPE